MSSGRALVPLTPKVSGSLNAMSASQWTLIEVIADSGACATVLPMSMCPNIKLRESVSSKAGLEYEVASGKAVKNEGEKHCEIFVEGAGASMLMHFQMADIHRPLLFFSAEQLTKDS